MFVCLFFGLFGQFVGHCFVCQCSLVGCMVGYLVAWLIGLFDCLFVGYLVAYWICYSLVCWLYVC